MHCRPIALGLLLPFILQGTIIDRIAIVVGNSIVKDSDISRDLRVTEFLNSQPLNLSLKEQKVAANRLIDQIFIRKEIELGDYPVATSEEADQQLQRLVADKYKSDAALQAVLQKYRITAPDLHSYFLWQLTVLRFIATRFKPAVLVTDAEVETYYAEHANYFKREHPGKATVDDVRGEINDQLAGERVDKLFFAWLDEQRKQTSIKYLEAGLE